MCKAAAYVADTVTHVLQALVQGLDLQESHAGRGLSSAAAIQN
jgi:hypothetical protein